MIRPNINHYKERSWLDGSTEGYKYEEYTRDLENYCDALERRLLYYKGALNSIYCINVDADDVSSKSWRECCE